MAKRNEVVFTGSVSWTENENSVETLDVAVPSLAPDEGKQYLVSVKNGSAVVDLTVSVANLVAFDSTPEAAEVTSFTAAASAKVGKVVTGFPLGTSGRLSFTKSAATAAAFSAYVEIRRA